MISELIDYDSDDSRLGYKENDEEREVVNLNSDFHFEYAFENDHCDTGYKGFMPQKIKQYSSKEKDFEDSLVLKLKSVVLFDYKHIYIEANTSPKMQEIFDNFVPCTLKNDMLLYTDGDHINRNIVLDKNLASPYYFYCLPDKNNYEKKTLVNAQDIKLPNVDLLEICKVNYFPILISNHVVTVNSQSANTVDLGDYFFVVVCEKGRLLEKSGTNEFKDLDECISYSDENNLFDYPFISSLGSVTFKIQGYFNIECYRFYCRIQYNGYIYIIQNKFIFIKDISVADLLKTINDNSLFVVLNGIDYKTTLSRYNDFMTGFNLNALFEEKITQYIVDFVDVLVSKISIPTYLLHFLHINTYFDKVYFVEKIHIAKDQEYELLCSVLKNEKKFKNQIRDLYLKYIEEQIIMQSDVINKYNIFLGEIKAYTPIPTTSKHYKIKACYKFKMNDGSFQYFHQLLHSCVVCNEGENCEIKCSIQSNFNIEETNYFLGKYKEKSKRGIMKKEYARLKDLIGEYTQSPH